LAETSWLKKYHLLLLLIQVDNNFRIKIVTKLLAARNMLPQQHH